MVLPAGHPRPPSVRQARPRVAIRLCVYKCDEAAGRLGDPIAASGKSFAYSWTPWIAREQGSDRDGSNIRLEKGQSYVAIVRGYPGTDLHLDPARGEGLVVGVMTSVASDVRVYKRTASMKKAAGYVGLPYWFDDGLAPPDLPPGRVQVNKQDADPAVLMKGPQAIAASHPVGRFKWKGTYTTHDDPADDR